MAYTQKQANKKPGSPSRNTGGSASSKRKPKPKPGGILILQPKPKPKPIKRGK